MEKRNKCGGMLSKFMNKHHFLLLPHILSLHNHISYPLPKIFSDASNLTYLSFMPRFKSPSSRNFPFRRLFDDAWPTERRTASTSSSWPVTPTCFLTSESRSPRVALLELLSRQPRGRPITVLRIETHSQPQTVRHTEWTNGVQQRVWNIANPNGSHETCTRCFYFLAFFPSIEHDSIDSQ